jgi:plasmid maintenance system antidote protein VapI
MAREISEEIVEEARGIVTRLAPRLARLFGALALALV